jgi:uncharacterized membrane protein
MSPAWPRSLTAHLRHHQRFYLALMLGVLAWMIVRLTTPPWHLAVAGNTFFGVYLASMAELARHTTASDLRRRAASTDEGILLIVLITLAAIVLSLGSIFALLNAPSSRDTLRLALSLVSLPLGWVTLHTVMALHYAHLFYDSRASDHAAVAGGLQFPDTPEPDLWDFLYYAFVVGMTAQVSDVQVLDTRMRRVTLAHGVVSFFFNTVILALAVNVAVGAAP